MSVAGVEPNSRVTWKTLFEDGDVLVLAKRSGLVTHPGVGHEHDTLLNGLAAKYGKQMHNMGKTRDFGLVHRLDKETSGVLTVALSVRAWEELRRQFGEREVRKFYWAVCHRSPRETEGVIRTPLAELVKRTSRYTSQRTAKTGGADAKPAVTAYRVLDSNHNGAVIEARPVTGRLHQVRAHLASVGASVVGDQAYASKMVGHAWPRLALHAHRLGFKHPVSGEVLDFRTAFPPDLRKLIANMGLERPDLMKRDSADGGDEIAREPVGDEEA